MRQSKKALSILLIFALVVTSLSLGFGFSAGALTNAGSWRFYAKTRENIWWNPTQWDQGTNNEVVIKMWAGPDGTGTLLYTSADLGTPVRNAGNEGSLTVTNVPTTNQIASITFNKVSGNDTWGCAVLEVFYTPLGGAEQLIGSIAPDAVYNDANNHLVCNTAFFTSDHNRRITFDSNGGTGTMANQYLIWGTSDYLLLNTFSRTGYSFNGWATSKARADAGIVDYTDGANFVMPDNSLTLYTVWLPYTNIPYVVYHYKQNIAKTAFDILALTENLTGTTGTSVTAADKYYTGFTAATPLDAGTIAGDGSLVLTQNYVRNSYTVTFDATGGTGGSEALMAYEESLSAPVVSKTGYNFNGWSPAVPSTVPAGNTTYTAQWIAHTYTIAYNGNGATGGTTASSSHTYNSMKTLALNGFTKTDYKFAGWSASPSSEFPTYVDGQSIVNLTDTNGAIVTLYAVWLKENSYIFTFDANGGTGGTMNTFVAGETLIAPTVARTGYTFTGWSPPLPTTVPAANTTYTAQWTPNAYEVNFNPQGGSVSPTTSTVTYNSTYGAGTGGWPTPAKAGSTFDGWYTAADGGGTQILTGTTVKITVAQTLYAKWINNTYVVSFNINGGTGTVPAAQPGISGTTITLPAQDDFTRQYYNFLGWATSSEATMPLSSYTISFEDITLYAVWSRVPVTLTAKSGSTTIINQSKGFIYGLEEGLTKTNFTNNFVRVNGDGELHITYYESDFGSGTKVELFDKVTLSVVKTYYIVIFGDVDGDGYITGGDENLIGLVASYQSEFVPGSAFEYAADLTQDEIVDSFDVNIISASTSYTGVIDQTNPGELI